MSLLTDLTLCMIVLGTSSVLGQSISGTELAGALRDIKPASGICLRDSFPSSNPDSDLRIATDVTDLTCAITPSELIPLLGSSSITLVDVRSRAEQGEFRIEGALNATPSELATKAFLRDKTVVMIGNGKLERELYIQCAELKKRGFKHVRVLRGGVPSWLLKDELVPNGTQGLPPPVRLTPMELWSESQFEGNLVLVVRSQSSLYAELPRATLIQDESLTRIRAVLEARRKSHQYVPLAALVLVASPDVDIDNVQALRRALRPLPLLLFSGTREAYLKQLGQQNAIWLARARGPKMLGCGL